MTQITEDTFEQVLPTFKESSTIDLRETTFTDLYGMVGLLEMGELFKLDGIKKILYLPESEEVLKYLERMDFFKFADRYFSLEPLKPQISEKYLRSSYSMSCLKLPRLKSQTIFILLLEK